MRRPYNLEKAWTGLLDIFQTLHFMEIFSVRCRKETAVSPSLLRRLPAPLSALPARSTGQVTNGHLQPAVFIRCQAAGTSVVFIRESDLCGVRNAALQAYGRERFQSGADPSLGNSLPIAGHSFSSNSGAFPPSSTSQVWLVRSPSPVSGPGFERGLPSRPAGTVSSGAILALWRSLGRRMLAYSIGGARTPRPLGVGLHVGRGSISSPRAVGLARRVLAG